MKNVLHFHFFLQRVQRTLHLESSMSGKPQVSKTQQSASKSKNAAGSESESEADMKFHRPSEIHKRATQKNAMLDLLAKRKDKENKAGKILAIFTPIFRQLWLAIFPAKKAALSIDAVFGKDDSDGSSSSSSSSSSTASSRSSSRESSPRRDGGSDDEEKKESRREVLPLRSMCWVVLRRLAFSGRDCQRTVESSHVTIQNGEDRLCSLLC